jgi:Ni,Fe-hydrogenase I cytochrome b subunit
MMSQDRYTKFILTVIAFSLFLIAINLTVTGFVLYDLYNEEMETLFSRISSRIDEISSSIDDVVEAIKKR